MRWMATAVAVVLLVVLTVGSALGAASEDAASCVRRVTQSPVNRDGRSCLVMWALGHGPYVEFTPDGWYSDLVDLLEANDIISYETTYELNFVDLSAYDVVVIGTLLSWDSAYTAAELTAIQDFVSAGGALLIMGDNSSCPNEHINLISEAYGVTCPVDGSDVGNTITDFAAIDLFADVASLQLASASALTVGSPSSAVAWASGGEPVMALSGDCAVIVTSDGDFWANDYIGLGDNGACALNTFACLCASDSPVESSSWGTIKALFR